MGEGTDGHANEFPGWLIADFVTLAPAAAAAPTPVFIAPLSWMVSRSLPCSSSSPPPFPFVSQFHPPMYIRSFPRTLCRNRGRRIEAVGSYIFQYSGGGGEQPETFFYVRKLDWIKCWGLFKLNFPLLGRKILVLSLSSSCSV